MIRFTEKLSERELARFLFPLMLSSIFQQLYAPVGAAAAGRFLNQEAVAVIGACSAWDLILDALFISMTTGFAISINRAAGMGKEKRLRETVQGAVLLSAVMTAGSFLLAVFPDPFMVLANIPPQMREESREYLRFLLLGGGFQGLQNLLICLIQGSGESRFPAIVTVGAVIAQTGLSLVLLGQLHMGVEGVSLAVLFSQMGSVLLLSAHYLKGRWGIPLLIPFKGGNPLIWRGLAASGMAKVLMTFLANAGAFVLQREINRFPVDTIAGYTYANSLMNLFTQPLSAYAIAANIMSAQNVGRGDWEMAAACNRRMTVHSMAWCVFYAAAAPGAVPVLMGLIAGEGASVQLLEAGISWFLVVPFSYPFLVFLMICRNALQGMEKYLSLVLLGFLEMAVKCAAAWVLIPVMGYRAVCMSTFFIWAVPGLTGLWLYKRRLREAKRGAE